MILLTSVATFCINDFANFSYANGLPLKCIVDLYSAAINVMCNFYSYSGWKWQLLEVRTEFTNFKNTSEHKKIKELVNKNAENNIKATTGRINFASNLSKIEPHY